MENEAFMSLFRRRSRDVQAGQLKTPKRTSLAQHAQRHPRQLLQRCPHSHPTYLTIFPGPDDERSLEGRDKLCVLSSFATALGAPNTAPGVLKDVLKILVDVPKALEFKIFTQFPEGRDKLCALYFSRTRSRKVLMGKDWGSGVEDLS